MNVSKHDAKLEIAEDNGPMHLYYLCIIQNIILCRMSNSINTVIIIRLIIVTIRMWPKVIVTIRMWSIRYHIPTHLTK